MEPSDFDPATRRVIHCARNVFLSRGFLAPSMAEIAAQCGLTRRGLYHHFRNKDEIYCAMLRLSNAEAFAAADWAMQKALARGASALDMVAEYLDVRFGKTRRTLARNPHGDELNATAFRVANDVMMEVSLETHQRMTALIESLCERGILRLRPGASAGELAQMLADGARGINQVRPMIAASQIARRYRRMSEVILYGCAEAPGSESRIRSKSMT